MEIGGLTSELLIKIHLENARIVGCPPFLGPAHFSTTDGGFSFVYLYHI